MVFNTPLNTMQFFGVGVFTVLPAKNRQFLALSVFFLIFCFVLLVVDVDVSNMCAKHVF